MNSDEEAMFKMMQPFIQNALQELVKTNPENESVREQANVLAVYIMNIRSVKNGFGNLIDAKTLAKLLYNLKQSDFDALYSAFKSAHKYKRLLEEK